MSGGYLHFAVTAFTSIFIIVDPLGNIPLFLALTSTYDEQRRRRASLAASLTCFFVLSAFAVAGPLILSVFNISIPAMRIAGGIILFAIGMQMLYALRSGVKVSAEEGLEAADREDVGLFPMGMPLLAGPAAITAVVVLAQTGPRPMAVPIVVGCAALISGLIHLILLQSSRLNRLLGRVGLNILVRLMGLILAIIGVQFVLNGLAAVLPGMLKQAGV